MGKLDVPDVSSTTQLMCLKSYRMLFPLCKYQASTLRSVLCSDLDLSQLNLAGTNPDSLPEAIRYFNSLVYVTELQHTLCHTVNETQSP